MECKFCKKIYKTQKTHDTHVSKYHSQKMQDTKCLQKYKISDIPKDILGLIFKFLQPCELLKCYNAGTTDIFYSQYNYIWEEHMKQIKLKRKLTFISYGLSYLKYTNNLCFDCLKQKSQMSFFYEIPLCHKCQKDNYLLITKTNAMKEYKITSNEIEKIQHMSVKNPYHKTGAHHMQLYLKSDIERFTKNNISTKKIIDPQKKLENASKKQNRIQKIIKKEDMENYTYYINSKMSYDRAINICRRHKELADKLYETYLLKIRYDSKLCTNYILGSQEHELDEIIDIVAETHWLFNYTDYQKRIKRQIEEEKDYYGEYDYYDIEHSVRNELRKNAPEIYPWLE